MRFAAWDVAGNGALVQPIKAECGGCDDHEVIETTKDTKITKTLFLFVFFVPSWLNSGRGYRELVAVEGFSAISVLVSVPRPS